ncbi:hypothetical protein BTN49_0952 [Candidatus Enterovibrio escicola]|uniref:Uncharacterized protein n=1 Tax=Candidatus Enterovibrio escicola TaxID=1927127 RepID=A0A2A5T5C0_9GAMM|nr:hypothetical protein BTN49_0952 [Candidatus Enterovibrio escacola]
MVNIIARLISIRSNQKNLALKLLGLKKSRLYRFEVTY